MKEYTKHYLAAALWTNEFDNYSIKDFDKKSIEKAEEDLNDFISYVELDGADLSQISYEMIGHDFWLTRNHHGTGFWDRGLGDLGNKLTEWCDKFGEQHCDIGDDGKVFLY